MLFWEFPSSVGIRHVWIIVYGKHVPLLILIVTNYYISWCTMNQDSTNRFLRQFYQIESLSYSFCYIIILLLYISGIILAYANTLLYAVLQVYISMESQELKMLTHLNLSCNRFVMFPLEAVLNQRLVNLDLSANKV